MESFKYKGTPEQMAKVADHCLANGAGWWDIDPCGPFLILENTHDLFYAGRHSSYDECYLPPMSATLELEIFGKTDKITGKPDSVKFMADDAYFKEPRRPMCLEDAYDSPSDGVHQAHLDATDPVVNNTDYSGNVKKMVAELAAITGNMSYNDSYFGEADGYLKSAIRELDHIINADSYRGKGLAAYKTSAEEVPIKRNKYSREIKPGVFCDVYDVIRAFSVTDGALQHLLKKALAVGQRGHKDAAEDYKDIVDSAVRAKEIFDEWNK